MNKILILFFFLVPIICFGQNKPFKITGNIGKLNGPAQLFLTYRVESENIKDSVVLNKGKFTFSGKVDGPVKATLTLDPKGVGFKGLGGNPLREVIYIDKGKFSLLSDDSLGNVIIKGSKINNDFEKYTKTIEKPQSILDGLNREWSAAKPEQRTDSLRASLMERHTPAAQEKESLQKNFIKNNPSSFFSLVALRELAGSDINLKEIEPEFLKLSKNVRNSNQGKAFAQLIFAAKATAVGAIAMDFTQNDTLDNPISLSDFRGKYVLLDFWASWCAPCRIENPNVVKAFNQYKDRDFTVLGVSLDQPGAKQKWIDAIHKDNLTWTHVSDLKFWDNAVARQYGIRAIPQNLLIDPSGKIIAKNIRGEELHKKLAEVFD